MVVSKILFMSALPWRNEDVAFLSEYILWKRINVAPGYQKIEHHYGKIIMNRFKLKKKTSHNVFCRRETFENLD